MGPISGKVIVDSDRCNGCGKCAELCPCSSLSIVNGIAVQTGYCMACFGCVVVCPKDAIRIEIEKESYRVVEVSKGFRGLEKFFQKRQPSSSSESS